MAALERWGPQEKGGGPKFRAFFSSSRLKFHSLCSRWASFRGISVVFEVLGPPKCTFGLSGSSCETPSARHTELRRWCTKAKCRGPDRLYVRKQEPQGLGRH